MIPLRDNIPSQRTPLVNYGVIAVTAIVFVLQVTRPEGGEDLVERYGMIPARVVEPGTEVEIPDREIVETRRGYEVKETMRPAAAPGVHPWLTMLTCIFLHGGWLHFLGNMWFLYIFGDNVEDRFGHFGYLLFYLGTGLAASGVHLASDPSSPIPTIGASGAIAGVMGAYFLMYPRSKVLTLVPIFFFIQIIVLPAPLFLGVWFLLQLLQGTVASFAMTATGVAWWAHIGGFVAGAAAAWLLGHGHLLNPPPSGPEPGTEHMRMYRPGHRGGLWGR